MCGIVGVINGSDKVKAKLGNIFSEMLFANQLRGFDGAGVFWYDNRDDTYAVRKNADFKVVFKDAEVDTALRWMEKIPFFVGHNRAATRGVVKTENNHPFDEGNVILVHNGTMTYIPKEFDKDVDVDSHGIAKMLNAGSTEAFIKDSFGAYALVWFDKVSRKLNLLRNKDRPLNIVYYKDFALIASESEMAEWIGYRNGFMPERVEEVKEHRLYQFEKYNLTPTITDLSHCNSFRDYDRSLNMRGAYPTLYDCDEYDEELEAHGIWVRERSNVRRLPVPPPTHPTSIVQQKAAFNACDVWDYFHNCGGRNYGAKISPIATIEQELPVGPVQLVRGQTVVFSLDQAKLHNKFAEIVGNLPNVPIASYEVRGHIPINKLTENEESTCYLRGVISQFKVDDDVKTTTKKVTIWVRDITFTEIEDPQFKQEDAEEKK